jgi:uncharacterized protein (DUF1501 family)
MITRRSLLATLPALGLAGPVRAATGLPRLVTVFLDGGWDTTLLLDPKPLTTLQIDEGEFIEEIGGLTLGLNTSRRPVTRAFFDRWASRATVVNGIWVGSIGHTACQTRVLHGNPDRSTPDLPTLAGMGLQGDAALGTIDLCGELEPGRLSPVAARLGRQQQVRGLIDPALGPLPPVGSGRPFPAWTPSPSAESAARTVMAARAARARAARPSTLADDLVTARQSADAWSIAAAGDVATWPTVLPTFEETIALAPALLAGGQCASVLLSIDGWDTHVDNTGQHALYDRLFASLDALLVDLEARLLLEDTLVLVVSEMSRNPTLNADLGKDHWPLTSALLLGGPLPSGRTLGGTDDGLGPVPVRLDTGEIGGDDYMRAENFVAGLLLALGVDPGPDLAGVTPMTALAS